MHFIEAIDKIDLWQQLTLEKLTLEKDGLVESLKNHLLLMDRTSCLNSTSLSILPMLVSDNNEKGLNSNYYLNSTIPLHLKKISTQIRFLNNFCTRIIIKNKKFNEKEFLYNYCEYCSEENNIIHALIYCNRFTNQRNKLFPELKGNVNANHYFYDILTNMDARKSRKMAALICIVLEENVITNSV